MANKLVQELELNATGFKKGTDEVIHSTDKMDHSLEAYLKTAGTLRQQLRKANNAAKDLAAQYNDLSATEKNTEWGKTIRENLEFAIRRAGELRDVMNDTNSAIKAAASDTATWDALKEGADIAKSATMAYVGALTQVTGRQEDLTKLVQKLTIIENTFNTCVKVGNALQGQSAIMMRLKAAQLSAAAKAEALATKNTIGATIAQKAFNLVAKANPYVLLATAAITAAAAVTTYMLATKKSAEAEKYSKEVKETLASAQEKYSSTFSSTAAETITKYKQLQAEWNTLRTTAEKDEFIKNHKKEFDEYRKILGKTATAEEILEKYSKDMVNAFIARAKGAAAAAKAQELYGKALELTLKREELVAKKAAEIAKARKEGTTYNYMAVGTTGYIQPIEYTAEDRIKEINKRYKKQIDEIQKSENTLNSTADKLIDKAVKFGNTVATSTSKASNSTNNTTKDAKKQVDYLSGSLAELEATLSQMETARKNGKLDNLNADEYRKEVNKLKQEIENKKIELGIELAKTDAEKIKAKIDELKKQQLYIDVNSDEWDAIQKQIDAENEKQIDITYKEGSMAKLDARLNNLNARLKNVEFGSDAWKEIQSEIKDIEKEKVELNAKVKEDILRSSIQNIVNKALESEDIKPDFSYLKSFNEIGKKQAEEAENAIRQIEKIKDAREKLNEVVENKEDKYSSIEIEEAIQGLQSLGEQYDYLTSKIEAAAQANDGIKERQKKIEDLAKSFEIAGQLAGSFGDLFGALGDLGNDAGMKAMGIVAQTIATLALSFAQAMTTCKTWYEWVAFGITGTAQLISMVSQIKSLNSGGYAGGGIIPGSSYAGDRLTANVNSGEMILNRRQQNNLFNAIDQDKLGGGNIKTTISSVRVQGSELILAINNERQKHGKSKL